jgi:DinB family protein
MAAGTPHSMSKVMEDALPPLIEMTEWLWKRFKSALGDVTAEEADWRPLPQANSISLIVRHLRIESQWHLSSLEDGAPMPSEATPNLQQEIDSVPLDFERNLKELDETYTRFIERLRAMTLGDLRQQTARAYQAATGEGTRAPAHFLGYHQTMHLAMHLGQITSIRNLYRKTRGEPARFFPDNPTFPK